MNLFSEKNISLEIVAPLGEIVSLISKIAKTPVQAFYRNLGEAIGNPDIQELFMSLLNAEVKVTYNLNGVPRQAYLKSYNNGWLYSIKTETSPHGISPKEPNYNIEDFTNDTSAANDFESTIKLTVFGPISVIASIIDDQFATRQKSFFDGLKRLINIYHKFPKKITAISLFSLVIYFDEVLQAFMMINDKNNCWSCDL